jgi:EAL domain-containing protein (putative c-di-GMP-specific phosphodiesterase class I)
MREPPKSVPPDAPTTAPVLCFTGAHARLPHRLAALRRRGLPIAVRRCTTLADFARELTRGEAGLVAVDCGPGNLRLADALGLVRRAGRITPLVVISEQTPEARTAIAALRHGRILSPDDAAGLEALVRAILAGGLDTAVDRGGDAVANAHPLDAPGAALPDQTELLDALRPVLRADAARAALAVLRITPQPDASIEAGLGRQLGKILGEPAILARLSGGGYGALLEIGDPAAGVALAHGAREKLLEHLHKVAPGSASANVAIGISPPRRTDGDRAEAWLARTREACEVAASTEHGYAVLSRTPVAAPSACDIPSLLQEALASNQLILQFQPIVSLRGDARQHYQTLVRLPSAAAGELLPGDFFGAARSRGLIAAVDHWVIRQAIRRLGRERATHRRVHFFIALSAETLSDERVLVAICDELRDSQAAGDWVTFQLRPNDIRAHAARARQLVEGLRRIRCRLALEGYDGDASCRQVLRSIPFDFAKLSPTLTRDLHDDPSLLERLRSAVAELDERGVRSVATAVEDSRTLAYLWSLGIDYAQGFFLQEPSETIAYDAAR